jgi:hypothetical protein
MGRRLRFFVKAASSGDTGHIMLAVGARYAADE